MDVASSGVSPFDWTPDVVILFFGLSLLPFGIALLLPNLRIAVGRGLGVFLSSMLE